MDALLLLAYAAALSLGQVLFKAAAPAAAGMSAPMAAWRLMQTPAFIAAAVLYAALTLFWTWLLVRVPLSQAYPFVALCFIFVPLLARWFFGERISGPYYLGLALIIAGLGIIQLSQQS